MKLEELTRYLDELLQPTKFRDYSPNGLQVEGCSDVLHNVAGVSASQNLLDIAVDRGSLWAASPSNCPLVG
jgi:putative NIF3 family GTP cyclohydrolase 1 type 2